jgi:hypothetical protein
MLGIKVSARRIQVSPIETDLLVGLYFDRLVREGLITQNVVLLYIVFHRDCEPRLCYSVANAPISFRLILTTHIF